jgi:hypothetical protein
MYEVMNIYGDREEMGNGRRRGGGEGEGKGVCERAETG